MLKKQFETHPAATLFPLMTEEEYQGLKQDISENGQRENIVVWCGKLIDGRNRLRACEELGREPDIAELDEDQDPWKYVISHNLHRRHLSTSQRAMVAGKLATLKKGEIGNGRKVELSKEASTLADASKQLKVGKATVERAKQVQQHGSESVNQAVEQNKIPVSLAAKLVKEVPDKTKQDEILSKGKKAVMESVPKKPKIEKPTQKAEEPVWVDVEDDEPELAPVKTNFLASFKELWNSCDAIGKKAIAVWLKDNYPEILK